MPMMGTPLVPTARAVRKMVPSPPSTTARSYPLMSGEPCHGTSGSRSPASRRSASMPCEPKNAMSMSEASMAFALKLLRTMSTFMDSAFPSLLA